MTQRPTTRTIARLHFEDLSHERFEDLCMQYFYPLKDWTSFQHWGRKGKDAGVDIAAEFDDDGSPKKWAIQCKRYNRISLTKLKAVLDDYRKQNPGEPPNCYWLLLACDLSRQAGEGFQEYCRSLKMRDVKIITASVLEAELYSKHPGILYAYFGIPSSVPRVRDVARIKHRMMMKRRIDREFLSTIPKRGHEIIVHDVHRDNYPKLDEDPTCISPWFIVEYLWTYHRGVSVLIQAVNVVVAADGRWEITAEKAPAGRTEVTALRIGDIPYDYIVEIDPHADEYRNGFHLYCEFSNGGTPYERIWYDPAEKEKHRVPHLHEDMRIRKRDRTPHC